MLPYVFISLRERSHWLNYCACPDQAVHGEVFVPGNTHVNIEDTVNVEVRSLADELTVMLRAVVLWRRPRSDGRTPAGIGLRFPAAEKRSLRLLHALGSGDLAAPVDRGDRRFPICLPVDFSTSSSQTHAPRALRRSLARNISRTGVALRTRHPAMVGAQLDLCLAMPPRYGDLPVRGTVVWATSTALPSMGVHFIFAVDDTRALLERYIAELAGTVDAARSSAMLLPGAR